MKRIKANSKEGKELARKYFKQMQDGGVNVEEVISGRTVKGTSGETYNAEVEKNEFIQYPDGVISKVEGDTHRNGGEKMELPAGTKVLSDNIKIGTENKKAFKDLFDINVKASDTFASVHNKLRKKAGVNSALTEQEKTLRKLKDNKEVGDDNTRRVNEEFLASQLYQSEQKLSKLRAVENYLFDVLFNQQEERKSSGEKNIRKDPPLENYSMDVEEEMFEDGGEKPKNGSSKKSTRKGKKLAIYMDGKWFHFGDSSMQDYRQHKDKDRKKAWYARHKKNLQGDSPRAKAFRKYASITWEDGGEVPMYQDGNPSVVIENKKTEEVTTLTKPYQITELMGNQELLDAYARGELIITSNIPENTNASLRIATEKLMEQLEQVSPQDGSQDVKVSPQDGSQDVDAPEGITRFKEGKVGAGDVYDEGSYDEIQQKVKDFLAEIKAAKEEGRLGKGKINVNVTGYSSKTPPTPETQEYAFKKAGFVVKDNIATKDGETYKIGGRDLGNEYGRTTKKVNDLLAELRSKEPLDFFTDDLLSEYGFNREDFEFKTESKSEQGSDYVYGEDTGAEERFANFQGFTLSTDYPTKEPREQTPSATPTTPITDYMAPAEQRLSAKMLDVPRRVPPTGLRMRAMENLDFEPVTPVKVTPEPAIVENQRQLGAFTDILTQNVGSQMGSNIADVIGKTQGNINQIVAQTNEQNARLKQQADMQNAQRKDAFNKMRADIFRNYGVEGLMALENQEQQMRAYSDAVEGDIQGMRREARELSTIDAMYPNFTFDPFGNVVYTPTNDQFGIPRNSLEAQIMNAGTKGKDLSTEDMLLNYLLMQKQKETEA